MSSSALEPIKDNYDYILIDCPPSLGLLTINALAAADGVLIPIQAEYYAIEGVSELLRTLERVREAMNPNLAVRGVLLTMVDERTNLGRQVSGEVQRFFGDKVYRCVVPRNVKLAEAPSFGKPIILYDIASGARRAIFKLLRSLCRMNAKNALGRGLDALLSAPGPEPRRVLEVEVHRILPNPRQPRARFDEESLADLAQSIRSNGVLQPILVRPNDGKYEIIAGERRWRAAQRRACSECPSSSARRPTPRYLELALVENIQREDLNPVDEARAYQMLVEDLDLSQEEVARRVGKERATVANTPACSTCRSSP